MSMKVSMPRYPGPSHLDLSYYYPPQTRRRAHPRPQSGDSTLDLPRIHLEILQIPLHKPRLILLVVMPVVLETVSHFSFFSSHHLLLSF